MTTCFSDREFGPRPMVEETIREVVWQAIHSLIETRINDGSLACGFPLHCPDGNAITGTDEDAVQTAIRAEIGDPAGDDAEAWLDAIYSWRLLLDRLPDTSPILDFVEFVARHVAQPTRVHRHDFFRHHPLELDREKGLRFVEDVNRFFSRNGLAYKLTDAGVIERTVPTPMAELLKRTNFSTGDQDLDGLLPTAIKMVSVAEAGSETGCSGETLGCLRAPQDHRRSRQESGSHYPDR